MNTYIIGILAAFAEPVLHAWANILDNYFSNKLFRRLTPLIFFSAVVGVIIMPIIWFLSPPSLVSFWLGFVLFLISLIEVLYLYPYYWALRHTDTSVVASLFCLGKVFIPIFAFFLVGERLTAVQYGGFFILVAASILMTLDFRKMRLNKAFTLMLVVSFVLSLQSVLLKYVYEQGVGYGSSIVWMTLFQFLIAGVLMLSPKNLADVKESGQKLKSAGLLLVGAELLSWGGTLGSSYAIYLIPTSIAKGIASTQAIFVLIYALLFAKIWPSVFKEYLGGKDVAKKSLLFAFIIIGILCITGI